MNKVLPPFQLRVPWREGNLTYLELWVIMRSLSCWLGRFLRCRCWEILRQH
jgi:hypothetical protein